MLIQKTVTFWKNGAFRNDLEEQVEIGVADWLDGSSCLSSSFLVGLINIMYDGSLFTPSDSKQNNCSKGDSMDIGV